MSYSGCATSLGTYKSECPTYLAARIDTVYLKKKSAVLVNPKSKSEWNALVTSGDAVILTDVRGQLPASEKNTVAGTGRQVEKIVGFTNTLTLTDFKVSDNWNEFYRAAHKASGYEIYFGCDDKIFGNNGEEVSFMSDLIITENTNEYINVIFTIKWTSIAQPSFFN